MADDNVVTIAGYVRMTPTLIEDGEPWRAARDAALSELQEAAGRSSEPEAP